ncbi:MAG TPA: hypothetical protein GXX28_09345 [Firmicutes bacterium]|nr:hypothetical protein [Bacillota bacterium]
MSSERNHERRVACLIGAAFRWGLAVLLWLAATAGNALAQGAEGSGVPILLRAGESRVIGAPNISRVAVGQPEIADVRVLSPTEVLINGRGEGQTTLLLWPASGRVIERIIRVWGPSPALSEADVGELLAGEPVRIRTVAGYVVVEGRPSPEGRTKLARLGTVLGPGLLDLTESPALDQAGTASTPLPGPGDLEAVGTLIRQAGGEGATLVRQAGKVVLQGRVPTESARRTAVRLAESFFPGQVVDAMEVVETRSLFAIKAKLVEVDRQAARELGLEWAAAVGLGEPKTPGGLRLEPWARLEPLLVKLKALEESGRARILAEPSMTVADEADGTFLAGGQIPVPLELDGQPTVEWKDYGVKLHVRPVLLASGRIRLTVRPEVSTLDWANGVRLSGGNVPALRSRWAETVVEQESGDTLILAGLSLAEETDHGGRVPGLSSVPLLGALFRTDRGVRRSTELTILLTTTLLPQGTEARPGEAAGEVERQDG